ncbi:type II CRISPR RNA-guided endonuclease Cas9 [Mycoplasmopsis lipofaciens]|uniref:type II CRISPR RNA-guided endonuclease Cas9 n=1 Tax=Mycoplasmopsis lipofaciens TaxID=114884 RepID=UPI000480F646|nr:type II CRISPR RNA-guided endonuclease Cas9 [Mycoplasmopsis lipofaciens]
MNKKNVTLGFDLGVGSVGWAILDNETNKILKLGSRLFKEPKLAIDRRKARSIRRSIRRKAYRNKKFYKLIIKYSNIFSFENKEQIEKSFILLSKKYNNILDLKLRGLNSKITKAELVWILHDYLENRGFFYTLAEIQKDKKEQKIVIENMLPTERMYNFYKKFGFAKNQHLYSEFSEYSKDISNKEWVKELNILFKQQDIDPNFTKAFLDLFTKIRSFEIGPGSENSASPYGVFVKTDDNKIIKKYNTVWEKNIGHCSIYPNEYRALKNSIHAELFNVLNDLNNLRNYKIQTFRLTEENKKDILNSLIEKFKSNQTKSTPKITIKNFVLKPLLKYINDNNIKIELDKSDDYGFKNPEGNDVKITELKNLYTMIQIFKENNSNFNGVNVDNWEVFAHDFDEILNILSKSNVVEQRKSDLEKLSNIKNYFDKEEQKDKTIDLISQNNTLKISNTSDLSIKCYKEFIPLLLQSNRNFEQIKFDRNFGNKKTKQNGKYINDKFLDKAILPPSVKTTMRESIKIFNKIIKLYSKEWNITKVVIEMAREKNGDEVKKAISNLNKINKKRNEIIEAKIKSLKGNSNNISDAIKTKAFLYFQQEHRDIYDGKMLDFDKVINDPNYTQIDHVIPYSLSLNNSSANKVLTKTYHNQNKGQKTAAQYVKEQNTWNWNEYLEFCNKTYLNGSKDMFPSEKSQKQKYHNLLLEKFDKNKQIEFMSRNLNDTRYATKMFKDELIDYAQSHNKQFKVVCINGAITGYIRKITKNYKNRDDYSHHAIDASILSIIANNTKTLFNLLSLEDHRYQPWINNDNSISKIDKVTGEIIQINSKFEKKKMYDIENIKNLVKNSLNNIDSKVQFSRKQEPKNNAQLFNINLYGSKVIDNNIWKIQKIKLLEATNKDLEKWFNEKTNKKEQLLIYKHSKKEYEKIQNIFLSFQNENKPFLSYMNSLYITFPNEFTKEAIQILVNEGKLLIYDCISRKKSIIGNLKYLESKIPNENSVVWHKNSNNKSFNDTLNSLGCLIYKNKKNKYSMLAVNSNIYFFGQNNTNFLDETSYKQDSLLLFKKEKNIDINEKPLCFLNIGKSVLNKTTQEILYICGIVMNNNTIELKYINKSMPIICEKTLKKQRIIKTCNSFMNEYLPIDTDVLGNIYK